MKKINVAAIQCCLSDSVSNNIKKIIDLIREAKKNDVHIIVVPELFEGSYFCKKKDKIFFKLAQEACKNKTIIYFSTLARDLNIVIIISFFEKYQFYYYNSVAVIDADGSLLNIYRKSHIPEGSGYEEKFYFEPGNTGFLVSKAKYGNIGVAICWDQWFSETARILTLQGSDIILYPTAIGSEPNNPFLKTRRMWQNSMIGHSVSNCIPIVAANRVGKENGQFFYGHSFIVNNKGEKCFQIKEYDEGYIFYSFNFQKFKKYRDDFGFFKDRRPELYTQIVSMIK